jgi:hypothetical protein
VKLQPKFFIHQQMHFLLILENSKIYFKTYTGCPTRYRTRLAGGPLLLVGTIRRTTDTVLVISHTMNVPPFKFRCNIFIGVRITKEMPVSVASGTHCIKIDPTCFGLRPSSGSLHLSLAKVTFMLKQSVKLRRYVLCMLPHHRITHNDVILPTVLT